MFQQKFLSSPSIEALNYFSELHPVLSSFHGAESKKPRGNRTGIAIALTQEPGSKSLDYADYSHW